MSKPSFRFVLIVSPDPKDDERIRVLLEHYAPDGKPPVTLRHCTEQQLATRPELCRFADLVLDMSDLHSDGRRVQAIYSLPYIRMHLKTTRVLKMLRRPLYGVEWDVSTQWYPNCLHDIVDTNSETQDKRALWHAVRFGELRPSLSPIRFAKARELFFSRVRRTLDSYSDVSDTQVGVLEYLKLSDARDGLAHLTISAAWRRSEQPDILGRFGTRIVICYPQPTKRFGNRRVTRYNAAVVGSRLCSKLSRWAKDTSEAWGTHLYPFHVGVASENLHGDLEMAYLSAVAQE